MNSLERLRWQLQIALVIDAHKPDASIPEVVDLAKRYFVKGDEAHIRSAIKRWDDKGYLLTYKTLDGAVGTRVRPNSLSDALSEVLDFLEADTFRVDWKKEQILTDAKDHSLIVCPDGWMLLELECDASSSPVIPTVPLAAASAVPVHIVNNFSPTNTFAPTVSSDTKPQISWSGWVGVILSLVGIVVAIWLAGKF